MNTTSQTNPSHTPNGTTDAAKAKLQPVPKLIRAEAYRDYLVSIGYPAKVTESGNVTFVADGVKYGIVPDEHMDRKLYITIFSELRQATDAADRLRAEAIIQHLRDDMPRVDLWLDPNGDTIAYAVLHLSDPLNLHNGFADCFTELKTAVERFNVQMAETKG